MPPKKLTGKARRLELERLEREREIIEERELRLSTARRTVREKHSAQEAAAKLAAEKRMEGYSSEEDDHQETRREIMQSVRHRDEAIQSQEEWERYIQCNPLPDARDQPGLKAYCATLYEAAVGDGTTLVDAPAAMAVSDEAMIVIRDTEPQLREYVITGQEEAAAGLREVLKRLTWIVRQRIDAVTTNHLGSLAEMVNSHGLLYEEHVREHIGFGLWFNAERIPRMNKVEFREMKVAMDVPRNLAAGDHAIRVTKMPYGRETMAATSREDPLMPYGPLLLCELVRVPKAPIVTRGGWNIRMIHAGTNDNVADPDALEPLQILPYPVVLPGDDIVQPWRLEVQPIRISMPVPNDLWHVNAEEPTIARWDPDTNRWETSGVANTVYDADAGVVSFHVTQLKPGGGFSFVQPRNLLFPFSTWMLRPLAPSRVLLVLQTAVVRLHIELQDGVWSLQLPDVPATHDLIDTPMRPAQLIEQMANRGMNILPESKLASAIAGLELKDDDVEDRSAYNIALASPGFGIRPSSWNGGVGTGESMFSLIDNNADEGSPLADWTHVLAHSAPTKCFTLSQRLETGTHVPDSDDDAKSAFLLPNLVRPLAAPATRAKLNEAVGSHLNTVAVAVRYLKLLSFTKSMATELQPNIDKLLSSARIAAFNTTEVEAHVSLGQRQISPQHAGTFLRVMESLQVAISEDFSSEVPTLSETQIPQETWPSVRLYIASTGGDMKWERDVMFRYVLPAMRLRYMRRQVHFNWVDVRYGTEHVPNAEKQIGVERILRTIDDCVIGDTSRDETRTFVLGLIGGTRGWTPSVATLEGLPEDLAWSSTLPVWERSMAGLEMAHGVFRRGDGAEALCMLRDQSFCDEQNARHGLLGPDGGGSPSGSPLSSPRHGPSPSRPGSGHPILLQSGVSAAASGGAGGSVAGHGEVVDGQPISIKDMIVPVERLREYSADPHDAGEVQRVEGLRNAVRENMSSDRLFLNYPTQYGGFTDDEGIIVNGLMPFAARTYRQLTEIIDRHYPLHHALRKLNAANRARDLALRVRKSRGLPPNGLCDPPESWTSVSPYPGEEQERRWSSCLKGLGGGPLVGLEGFMVQFKGLLSNDTHVKSNCMAVLAKLGYGSSTALAYLVNHLRELPTIRVVPHWRKRDESILKIVSHLCAVIDGMADYELEVSNLEGPPKPVGDDPPAGSVPPETIGGRKAVVQGTDQLTECLRRAVGGVGRRRTSLIVMCVDGLSKQESITLCGIVAHSQYAEYVRLIFSTTEVPTMPDGVGPREGCIQINVENWSPEVADDAVVRCCELNHEIIDLHWREQERDLVLSKTQGLSPSYIAMLVSEVKQQRIQQVAQRRKEEETIDREWENPENIERREEAKRQAIESGQVANIDVEKPEPATEEFTMRDCITMMPVAIIDMTRVRVLPRYEARYGPGLKRVLMWLALTTNGLFEHQLVALLHNTASPPMPHIDCITLLKAVRKIVGSPQPAPTETTPIVLEQGTLREAVWIRYELTDHATLSQTWEEIVQVYMSEIEPMGPTGDRWFNQCATHALRGLPEALIGAAMWQEVGRVMGSLRFLQCHIGAAGVSQTLLDLGTAMKLCDHITVREHLEAVNRLIEGHTTTLRADPTGIYGFAHSINDSVGISEDIAQITTMVTDSVNDAKRYIKLVKQLQELQREEGGAAVEQRLRAIIKNDNDLNGDPQSDQSAIGGNNNDGGATGEGGANAGGGNEPQNGEGGASNGPPGPEAAGEGGGNNADTPSKSDGNAAADIASPAGGGRGKALFDGNIADQSLTLLEIVLLGARAVRVIVEGGSSGMIRTLGPEKEYNIGLLKDDLIHAHTSFLRFMVPEVVPHDDHPEDFHALQRVRIAELQKLAMFEDCSPAPITLVSEAIASIMEILPIIPPELAPIVNKKTDNWPTLLDAEKQLVAIGRPSWSELKLTKPPLPGAVLVMEAVCIMLRIPPVMKGKKEPKVADYWTPAKKLLGDKTFLSRLLERTEVPTAESWTPLTAVVGEFVEMQPAPEPPVSNKMTKAEQAAAAAAAAAKLADAEARAASGLEPPKLELGVVGLTRSRQLDLAQWTRLHEIVNDPEVQYAELRRQSPLAALLSAWVRGVCSQLLNGPYAQFRHCAMQRAADTDCARLVHRQLFSKWNNVDALMMLEPRHAEAHWIEKLNKLHKQPMFDTDQVAKVSTNLAAVAMWTRELSAAYLTRDGTFSRPPRPLDYDSPLAANKMVTKDGKKK